MKKVKCGLSMPNARLCSLKFKSVSKSLDPNCSFQDCTYFHLSKTWY